MIIFSDPVNKELSHVTISRIEDVEADLSNLNIIRGIKATPKLSLMECLDFALKRVPTLHPHQDVIIQSAEDGIKLMMKKFKEIQTLTVDEAAAVYMYTQNTALYIQVNYALRVLDREAIKPFFPYIRLLLDGLHNLPLETRTVYRGVKPQSGSLHDIEFFKKAYDVDTEFVWWAFTSSTGNISTLSKILFHGDEGDRIKFIITTRSAIDIRVYSAFPNEDERIIMPGTKFKVIGCLDCGHGLYEIQIEEIATRVPYIDHPHPGWTAKK